MSAVVETFRKVTHTLEETGNKLGETMGFIEPPGTVLITGATGVLTHRVAHRLLDAGYPTVRVGTHDVDKAKELEKRGAEIVEFCWDKPETYAGALEGVTSVFCTTPYIKGWMLQFPKFLEACQKSSSGVKNIVKVSFIHSKLEGDPFHDVPLVKLHGDCDKLLEESGLSYTILAASHFMSQPLMLQGKELRQNNRPAMYYGSGRMLGVNYVSPNDVADVATRVLLNPKPHHCKLYRLIGPEAITDETVAELLGKYLTKPVIFFKRPPEFFEDEDNKFEKQHPVWEFTDLLALERIKASGKEDVSMITSKDIENLCERPAETFEEYLMLKERMSMQELE